LNSLGIKAAISTQGYNIESNRKTYSVAYDNGMWSRLKNKKALLDNIAYGRTVAFRMITDNLNYSTSLPFFKKFLDEGVARDIPKVADSRNQSTKALIAAFNKNKVAFADDKTEAMLFDFDYADENKALLGMSFGKDCLLTFGIASEIGMDVTPIFISDMQDYNVKELEYKKKIMQEFMKQFSKKVVMISDNTDSVYYDESIPGNYSSFDEINAMFQFAMQLLTVAHSTASKYIMFGNEQNHNDTYKNRDGFKTYPCGDQASDYMVGLNKSLLKFTSGNNQVMSLIEPLYNLGEMQLLKSRYSQFLPLIMSCSAKDLDKSRWCSNCPMCAKFYAFCLAVGIDVRQFGFMDNMLRKKYAELFPLFNENPKRPYEKPKEQRDEQLLTFYLAYKNGAQGELIDEFKQRFLKEAKEREEELRKKFLGIHPSPSIPDKIRKHVVSIYKEELSKI